MKLTRSVHLNPFLIFLIPLVDLCFLLLLLFLVSSSFLLHPGISVNLPFSKFTLGPQRNPIVVSITAGPYPLVYYRDQQIKFEDLAHRLKEDHSTDRSIIIQSDQLTPQGSVVEVMNLCLENGYSVVLATSPKEQ
ncbi:MAG: biopolymer transporter ExbD [Verrucomicrobia bacterium]|nr:biopolymer transporter ExbD [Verrucomicrobiota bacterium]MBV9130970.1 biopolymer transporter ExbD [Verrucomicrobiota bacterium]MBV9298683.1 biopolymer transporter ExbD [Verrucomicrobiota bacterium]MBV9643486.1 biopolymer transporter ExbD [Verrucomicrobiota bacterium]